MLNVDVVWTAEFAAKGYVEALPPDLSTEGHLKPAGRRDVLQQALRDAEHHRRWLALLPQGSARQVPTAAADHFDEMKAACDKITAGEKDSKLACFAGQYNKYEGLTVNFDEAVHGAWCHRRSGRQAECRNPGGHQGPADTDRLVQGRPHPEGRDHMDRGRRPAGVPEGELIFHRNWGYVYNLANKTDGSSKVAGKFDVAPLPGITGPGVSSLGGTTTRSPSPRRTRARLSTSEVHVVGGSEVRHVGDLALADVEELYSDPDGQEVALHADPAEVDPDRSATSEGRGVR